MKKNDLFENTLMIIIDTSVFSSYTDRLLETLRTQTIDEETGELLPYINTVFLSLYTAFNLHEDDYWYVSQRQKFENRIFSSKLKNQRKYRGTVKGSKRILDYRPSNKLQHCIGVFQTQDLIDYIEHSIASGTPIKNIMVVGESWQQCMRDRPLGVKNLIPVAEKYKLNIVTDVSLTAGFPYHQYDKEYEKHVESTVKEDNWKKVKDDVWYLPKREYSNYLERFKNSQREMDKARMPKTQSIKRSTERDGSGSYDGTSHVTVNLVEKIKNTDELSHKVFVEETPLVIDSTSHDSTVLPKPANSLVIGFTCSTFDLFHAGHVAMLEEAKKQCDHLIVGIQSDPSNDRPEKNKPIQSLLERQIQVRGCKFVDETIIYHNEKELLVLLQTLPIDVRILGIEYKDKEYTGKGIIPVYYNRRNHHFSSSQLRSRLK